MEITKTSLVISQNATRINTTQLTKNLATDYQTKKQYDE